jgi:hypothetical protein
MDGGKYYLKDGRRRVAAVIKARWIMQMELLMESTKVVKSDLLDLANTHILATVINGHRS